MMMSAPRRLALVMLPVLAAALYMVNTESLMVFVRFAEARNFDDVSSVAIPVSWMIGPLFTALVFAYPTARLYPRFPIAAALLIGLPTILYRGSGLLDNGQFADRMMTVVLTLPTLVLLPALAWVARRALAGSRLVIIKNPAAENGNSAAELPGTVSPRVLMLVLLPLFAISLFILHDLIQPAIWDIAFMPATKALRRAGELVGALIGPALVMLVLAYPIARIYQRHAVVVGMLIPIPTVWHWVLVYLQDSQLPGVHNTAFSIATDIVELVSLSAMLALGAWLIRRRLGDSRLVIVAGDARHRDVGA